MVDFPGAGHPHGEHRSINLQELDLPRLERMFRWAGWLVAIVVLLSALGWAHTLYTDWHWFRAVGHDDVLVTTILARVGLYLLALVLFLALALPNLHYARRATGGTPALPEGLSSGDYRLVRKLLVGAVVGFTLLFALMIAARPASEWETVLLFLNRVPFGEVDPIFERDFGFFVFVLPTLELLRVWLLSALMGVALIVAGFYYMTSRTRSDHFAYARQARVQLALLGAGLFVLIAAGHWLGRYQLMYSPTGAVFGVGYTDNYVNLPGRAVLTLIALGSGIMLAVGAFSSRSNRLLVWPVLAWVAATLLIGVAAPNVFQRLRVEPSELALERDFLANNIRYTRQAFGLDQLQSRSHPALGAIDPRTVAENQGTIQNVRLWDESPLLQSYNQIQFFRLYYDFLAVHTDRYVVDGELRQVMLATRELSAEKLPQEAQRWVNRQLQFTHGYGVAMSPVTEVDEGGRPSFLISDVPPEGPIPLERPEIYYGLKSLDYVIVRSGMQEFNYPGQDGPAYTRYEGRGGVQLSSLFRRLMYAWEFRDINILISGEVNADSRIQYRRTVQQRFSTIAPFLLRDREAYSVVADGRLFWIQDAYTVTDRYPYSTGWGGRFNYIRNSVKAVVDAYDGSVHFYVFEPDDPLVQAYQRIFPEMFSPEEEMPEYLRAHVRVPQDQFHVQTQMLLQYHMQDPVVFYNKEDQWSVPVQTSFGRSQVLRPYYIVARLPGEVREEFLLIQPFTPANRHNLVGWMAARSDGENYGELVLFRFPSGRHVDGPSQVEARIDNDAVISEQFTLWGQVGSEVMRGILLVIPLGDALLYAEPVFLRPETLEFPELRRIILADATQVVMHPTLDGSIGALVGQLPPVAPPTEPGAAAPQPSSGSIPAGALEGMRRTLEDAIRSLQRAVQQIGELTGDTTPR
ncbi:MAG TPA: UPF0182 family protein [Longimicrobiales bacterium]|nr:UPF0182 family protein [Longimicrobiales bacterium]